VRSSLTCSEVRVTLLLVVLVVLLLLLLLTPRPYVFTDLEEYNGRPVPDDQVRFTNGFSYGFT